MITSPEKVEKERSEKKSNTVGVTNSGLLGASLGNNFKVSTPSILIKSPKVNSKFAPADRITNSPTVVRQGMFEKSNSKELKELSQFSLNGNSPYKSPSSSMKTDMETLSLTSINSTGSGKNSPNKNIPVRKNRNNLTNIDDVSKKTSFPQKEYKDIQITKAVKRESGNNLSGTSSNEFEKITNALKQEFGNLNIEDEPEEDIESHEGYLYKITETKKIKKIYFKLIGKDIYCKLSKSK